MTNNTLKENRIHGTEFFPVSIYEGNQKPENMIINLHWHEEWEFLFVTAGEALFQVGNKQEVLKTGQIMFPQNRAIHGGTPITQQSCSFRAIVFQPRFLADDSVDPLQIEYIEPFLNGEKNFPDFIFGETAEEKKIALLLNDIFELCLQKTPGYELYVKGSLLLVWSILLLNDNVTTKPKKQRDIQQLAMLKCVLTFIHGKYQDKIMIFQLAESIHMSEGYFCHFFKNMMHMTPTEYIQRYRIMAAAKQLSNTQQQIIEIAYNCGFYNLSYFYQVFKKYMNCTPSEYRFH
jgi:AraC-like DNA-binding protein